MPTSAITTTNCGDHPDSCRSFDTKNACLNHTSPVNGGCGQTATIQTTIGWLGMGLSGIVFFTMVRALGLGIRGRHPDAHEATPTDYADDANVQLRRALT